MRPWTDYYPNGRYVYYEGDDPHTFVREMKGVKTLKLRLTNLKL